MNEEDAIFWRKLEVYHQSLRDAVLKKYELLPQISALSATLLVVATFHEGLLPVTICVRIFLVILLVLIPISLVGYLWELERAEKSSLENIKRLGNRQETIQQSRNLFTAYLPRAIIAIISVVIIFIILDVANNI